MDATRLVIDGEFKRQHDILTIEERTHLENNIIADGCIDPLAVWNVDGDDAGPLILLDGHNRFEICTANGIPFDLREIENISTRDDAAEWIDTFQLGRRNLSPDSFRITSGRLYNRRKKQHGGTGFNQYEQKPQFDVSANTAEQVALELGTSKATIERNGQRASVYDSVLSIGDEEAALAAKQATQADIAAVKDKPPEVAAAELKARKAVHVSQNTGMPEWYTPEEYLEAARFCMGCIDFDPASSDIANERVRAKRYCTVDCNGLDAHWFGNVWMNPPYTAGLVDKFCDKLISEYSEGDVEQAIVLVNNSTDTRWWQRLCSVSSALCFPQGRIKFIDIDGNANGAPLQGQSLLYLGPHSEQFVRNFEKFGQAFEVEPQ